MPTPTTIITGAASGIGLAIASKLFAEGHCIVLNDLDGDLLQKVHASTFASSVNVLAVAGDSADAEVRSSLIEGALNHFGGLDHVVANAGITIFAPFLETKPEAFDRLLQVNLKGTFFLVQEAINRSLERGSRPESILLLSSVTGIQAHSHLTAYGMTKAAIAMMAKNLVAELSPLGIRINALSPGATLTERTTSDEYIQTWTRLTPIGKVGEASEVAEAAFFLLNAKHITGQNLVIDGGWSAISPNP